MELSKLNSDKAYIQVTFAEPYFDNYGKFAAEKRHDILMNLTCTEQQSSEPEVKPGLEKKRVREGTFILPSGRDRL